MNDPSPFPTRQHRRAEHAVVNQVCLLLKKAYLDEKRLWEARRDGRRKTTTGDDATWNRAWPKIAQFLVKNRIGNYQAFMRVQFSSRNGRGYPPTPQQCYGPTALKRWQEHLQMQSSDHVLNQIRLAYEYQKDTYSQHISKMETMCEDAELDAKESEIYSSVLFDPGNQLTALFRYCAAVEEELAEVAEHYRAQALLQYSFAKEAYDEIWKDWIPEELRDEADNLERNLMLIGKEKD